MDYPKVTPQNIWNFRQNNPELIIQDARNYLGLNKEQCQILRIILLARGVNKWLKVRRDLIAYKKQLKHKIKAIEKIRLCYPKRTKENLIYMQISKTLQQVRSTLKCLCKTDRWQIWPQLGSHHKELKAMNTLKASD